MEKLIEAILQNRDIRVNLIEIRQRMKQPGEREVFLRLLSDTSELSGALRGLLADEDPKVRKNAALIIGEANAGESLLALYEAYCQEETLFIRGDYLKAMGQMDYRSLLGKLKERLEEMKDQEVPQEELKHYREEMTQLQKLLLKMQPGKKHVFTGMDGRYDVLLTCNRNFCEVTARQVNGEAQKTSAGKLPTSQDVKDEKKPDGWGSMVSLGVRVRRADLRQIFRVRTFRELLFVLNVTGIGPEPEEAARALAGSNLLSLLVRGHDPKKENDPVQGRSQEKSTQTDPFRFRITVIGKMPLDKRSAFIRKCSFALEQASGRKLLNSASDYEVELRLMERKDGTFLPLLKLHTLKDPRFSYRRESIAASIHPADAALIAALTRTYLIEDAQVLDPFCGVGTMLVERDIARRAKGLFGVDIFGEAIEKARENAKLAEKEIHYVNRDFFDFTHKGLFDEIFTNMPIRGKKTREEQDAFYQSFFEKAEDVLKPGGIMVLYSNEKGFIKKQLRLREEWKLVNEFCLNEKEDFSVFVIRLREK